ncbi:MAG: peptidoglycan binding protein CsiV [Gammaproteobacteria bacterium]|nr:peptidoglycan binding protein CsiV [Gammaproteobacteria bacterium]
MTKIIAASAGATFLLVAAMSLAQQQAAPNAVQLESEQEPDRQYSVEMIVFEYVGSAAGTTEIFEPDLPIVDEALPVDVDFLDDLSPEIPGPNSPPQDDLPLAIDIPVSDEMVEEPDFVALPGETLEEIPTHESAGFRLIDPADYQLRNAWNRLVDLDAYRPLMHTGWIQPTLEKEDTTPLPLRRLGNPPLRLNGTISLYLSRFLHMVVDLSLEHKAPQRMVATQERVRLYGDNQSRASRGFDAEFITPSIFYRIEEDRIVRNNELRYFDHPKFGVLAKITRIEEEEPEEPDTTDDLLPGAVVQ